MRAEDAARLASGRHGETLPASRVMDSFRVEKEGKRAATLGWVGCQSAQKFGPVEIGTGETAQGKRGDPPGETGCQSSPNGIKTSAIHCSVKDTARHFVLLDALMASMMAGKQIVAAGMEGGRSSIRLDPFTA